ncbi:neuronal vesicle trafficking-associated protein 1-like [Pelmatolapia mariae]
MDGCNEDVTSLAVQPDTSSSIQLGGNAAHKPSWPYCAPAPRKSAASHLKKAQSSTAGIKPLHCEAHGSTPLYRLIWLAFFRAGKMVKLGNNFSEKTNGKVVSEDGFDTIPLITPLDASQLQFPPPDKVVVKTKADYDGESKKGKLRSPKIAEFSISIIEGVSERLKVTLLVICALAFLMCVVFLVVYKVYQYEQPCPDSFVYTQGRCMPAGLYGNYPPQGPGGRGRLFTLINHYNIAKQTITRSVSPWVTIMSEEKVTQQETETAQKLA